MNDYSQQANAEIGKLKEANNQLRVDLQEAIEALNVLATLDLTGVNGEIVYQRNKTKITVSDITKAKALLSKHTQK